MMMTMMMVMMMMMMSKMLRRRRMKKMMMMKTMMGKRMTQRLGTTNFAQRRFAAFSLRQLLYLRRMLVMYCALMFYHCIVLHER